MVGSVPRVLGVVMLGVGGALWVRFSPAGAGVAILMRLCWVQSRGRGEDEVRVNDAFIELGSAPRKRGMADRSF